MNFRYQSRSILFIILFLLLILFSGNVDSYGCDCSCCTGSGCNITYLGTIQLSTCSGTTCSDNCKSKYSTCSVGSISAVCSATNIFNFYSLIFLIFLTILFVYLKK